jgi:hypothetical protein
MAQNVFLSSRAVQLMALFVFSARHFKKNITICHNVKFKYASVTNRFAPGSYPHCWHQHYTMLASNFALHYDSFSWEHRRAQLL